MINHLSTPLLSIPDRLVDLRRRRDTYRLGSVRWSELQKMIDTLDAELAHRAAKECG